MVKLHPSGLELGNADALRRLALSAAEQAVGEGLDRAREDLAQGSEPVSAVARRWGYANAGRFAAAYASRFGEAPAETRENRRPSPPRPATSRAVRRGGLSGCEAGGAVR